MGLNTVQVPGGTQALERTEVIEAEIGGVLVSLRRPTLLGAVLIKARSILEHADPDAQRADLVLLLSLIDDPRQMASELKGKERSWLHQCEILLGLDDAVLMAPFQRTRVQRAQLAYRLLSTNRPSYRTTAIHCRFHTSIPATRIRATLQKRDQWQAPPRANPLASIHAWPYLWRRSSKHPDS